MARTPRATARIELRLAAEEKALIARAAALEHADLTAFILQRVLPEARDVIDRSHSIVLSERDSLRVMEYLKNPPPPGPRLVAAMKRDVAARRRS